MPIRRSYLQCSSAVALLHRGYRLAAAEFSILNTHGVLLLHRRGGGLGAGVCSSKLLVLLGMYLVSSISAHLSTSQTQSVSRVQILPKYCRYLRSNRRLFPTPSNFFDFVGCLLS